jgi:hypothetical protein
MMTARQSMFMVIMAALAFGWAGTAGAGPAEQCEGVKLKASGKKAESRKGGGGSKNNNLHVRAVRGDS